MVVIALLLVLGEALSLEGAEVYTKGKPFTVTTAKRANNMPLEKQVYPYVFGKVWLPL